MYGIAMVEEIVKQKVFEIKKSALLKKNKNESDDDVRKRFVEVLKL